MCVYAIYIYTPFRKNYKELFFKHLQQVRETKSGEELKLVRGREGVELATSVYKEPSVFHYVCV